MTARQRLRGTAIVDTAVWDDAEIIIESGRIVEVLARSSSHQSVSYRAPACAFIAPGLIDTHVHGAMGADVTDGTTQALCTLSQFLARHGTTSFLPTTVSAGHDTLVQALRAVSEVMAAPLPAAARVLGVHLEGPYLNPEQRGAQNARYLRNPDVGELRQYLRLAPVKIVTMAPELAGFADAFEVLREAGVVVSFGHTRVSYGDAQAWIERGLRHATHVFNGMPPIHHRDPGPAGAALFHPGVDVELIADGVHVHPGWIRWLAQTIGSRIVLITDAMRATGLPDGRYDLGELGITVQDGVARTPEGHLAGSTLTLLQAVMNYQRFAGVPWPAAVAAASSHPARLLGLEHQKGRIAEGYDADLIVFQPNGAMLATMIAGQWVWHADA
jgi:N-acetylglucosamine-6-phosphate deacetylase